MKRPAFQFYPNDWSSNPNLRRCSFSEKGIWVEVMCLMHDQDEYGVLRWPLKEISEAVGCKSSELQSLIRKGVLKGADDNLSDPFIYIPRSGRKNGPPVTLIDIQCGPIWYSSRMVKDEYIRTLRADNGMIGEGFGASPKPPIGEGFGVTIPPPKGPRVSSSSSSTSVKDGESPPIRKPKKQPKTSLPSAFVLDTELLKYVTDHLPDADPAAMFESFTGKAAAKGWEYSNWARAFQDFVRNAMQNSGHFSAGSYPRKVVPIRDDATPPELRGVKWM